MRDAWLTSTKHTHPKLKAGIPLKEARGKYDKIGTRIEELLTGNAEKPIRVSCVGNSITEGKGVVRRDKDSYPALLQDLLGEGYRVMNFGSSGKTVINVESNAYTKTNKYQKALESRPNIVTIKLGTNDSRMPFREMIQDSFVVNYKNLIRSFRELPGQPRIMLLLPVTSYITAEDRHTDNIISSQVIPRIRQVAFEEKLEMVDLHSITADNSAIFPDSLHPNEEGMSIIGHRLEEAILSEPIGNFDVFESIKVPYKVSSFYGYDCADFNFDGRKAKVVKPRVLAKGSPWVWRARFWDVEPQADIALLDRGFHIVYCDVSGLYGNDEAMEVWDDFYKFLTSAGLSKKAVLEGFSRGGFYAYVWAIQNPDKVACVYADAPVLDIRSWPGGKGKSKGNMEEWRKFMQSYGYNSEVDVLKFTNNPINNVANIVKGGYPILHVVGSVDVVVPVDENTALFEQEVKRLGGDITVIYKRNVGHHPHSLTNPQPIVDFILKAVNQ
jgi:lysophospholipase L1-like esterase/pimeloyl-ACP methyl ester carboxylesterase